MNVFVVIHKGEVRGVFSTQGPAIDLAAQLTDANQDDDWAELEQWQVE